MDDEQTQGWQRELTYGSLLQEDTDSFCIYTCIYESGVEENYAGDYQFLWQAKGIKG